MLNEVTMTKAEKELTDAQYEKQERLKRKFQKWLAKINNDYYQFLEDYYKDR